MKITKIVNLKTVVLAASMMAPVAFAEGIDVSAGVAYVTGGLAAVALLGAAFLGLDNLKKVWSKLTATRI
ncbi:hypothetical protein [Vibrio mimicus]|uniref:hypothetical protein n=1 Tax=Vibrio mimicus TaxID=674 RepID=UPI0011DABCC6|nr:hypothetical protein [Vibrio mimicus]TXY07553.1 hypothetical protein FXF05_01935 [Vibrio mimicus]